MLRRYGFFRRIGMFGVEPDTAAGAAQFLSTSRASCPIPRRMLWVTAQGRFADPREGPWRCARRGASAGADARGRRPAPRLEYPFWSEKRPEALACFGEPLDGREGADAQAWARGWKAR
jgi:hypothetical protein